jgi:plasmid stabilization system protein ParE
MAAQNLRVIFTESAWEDIGEVVRYWTDRDEPERGEQYAYDLPTEAIRQLSDCGTARRARAVISATPPTRRRKSCRSSSTPTVSFTC